MPAYENDLFDYKLSDGSDAMYCIYGLHTRRTGDVPGYPIGVLLRKIERYIPYLTYLTLHRALPP